MHIKEKIYLDKEGLKVHGPIDIVAFGDSVTYGALGYQEVDFESVYWHRLRQKLNAFRTYPVNVINAGIGGMTASGSLERMERQVLKHEPDLVIVAFGVNDVNKPIELYTSALKTIFERCLAAGCDVIYMTQFMLNTYVADDTPEPFKEYAIKTAEMQNAGMLDKIFEAGKAVAKEAGVPICDCYSVWKKMSETQDMTLKLANRINHPVREMHQLFADMLFDVIMGTEGTVETTEVETMYTE